jgi:hypothetical protein
VSQWPRLVEGDAHFFVFNPVFSRPLVRNFRITNAIAVNRFIPNASAVKKGPEVPLIAKPEVDIEALTRVEGATAQDSFVYVHCYFQNKWQNMLIRI